MLRIDHKIFIKLLKNNKKKYIKKTKYIKAFFSFNISIN